MDGNTPWQPADDWTRLEGLVVDIYDRDKLFARGTVDATTTDGDVLWLRQDGVQLRQCVEKTDGRHVRISSTPPSYGDGGPQGFRSPESQM